MTITATPLPDFAPPKVDVTVAVSAGAVMSSVSVWRNDHNGRTPLRVQPAAGFDSRTVPDYECPYGESVTYDWIAAYVGSFTSLWNETWASTAAWTTRFGTWGVSAGKARNTAGPAAMYRALTPGKYRFVFSNWSVSSGEGYISFDHDAITFDNVLRLRLTGGVLSMSIDAGAFVATTISAASAFTIDITTSGATITGTGGSLTLGGDIQVATISLLSNDVPNNGYLLDDVQVYTYDPPSSIAETSGPVILNPDDGWLIHPGSPSLSFPIASDDESVAGIQSIDRVENPSNATAHRILGSSLPLPTTTGPRGGDVTALRITTVTNDERLALRGLLADDVPILVQIPPEWGLEFDCGFYQVGDTTSERLWNGVDSIRIATLPMLRVQSPVIDVEAAGWTYAAVAVEFATYTAVHAAFVSYAALQSNTRA